MLIHENIVLIAKMQIKWNLKVLSKAKFTFCFADTVVPLFHKLIIWRILSIDYKLKKKKKKTRKMSSNMLCGEIINFRNFYLIIFYIFLKNVIFTEYNEYNKNIIFMVKTNCN